MQDNGQQVMVRTLSPIVELRRYTLHPGRRDVLIDLFEREFLESQEATGMTLIGQFRDLDAPDQFVWLRGFADMPSRAAALQAFYGGPVWQANRAAANATMIDSDDVLLLRPAHPESGFPLGPGRPPQGSTAAPGGIVVATTWHLHPAAEAGFMTVFDTDLVAMLHEAGVPILAIFVSEHSENTFPALPVREDTRVFVWFSRFPDRAAYERHAAVLARMPGFAAALLPHLVRAPEVALLSPTARSRLRV
ncbi:quinol monooxygenase YgiN [Inquilinus ginsengisoli]|uniref:Quinol monooxygenase YgiN n=1 Tax=Inquilinus ginsengisoli TaxID=363840 RepID=A0ABU1JRV1_9PROT|nr:NIPSNAP family protein [Inquilinus ginsengisoli]MDR6291350.1 quinol monooxygenase YgiN [Inquilinus ginsengisoli]